MTPPYIKPRTFQFQEEGMLDGIVLDIFHVPKVSFPDMRHLYDEDGPVYRAVIILEVDGEAVQYFPPGSVERSIEFELARAHAAELRPGMRLRVEKQVIDSKGPVYNVWVIVKPDQAPATTPE